MPTNIQLNKAENLAETLDEGNFTTNGQQIVAQNGGALIDLRAANTDDFILITNDPTGQKAFLVMQAALVQMSVKGFLYINQTELESIFASNGVTAYGYLDNGSTGLKNNSTYTAATAHAISVHENISAQRQANGGSSAVFINTGQNPATSKINQGVDRTVIASGKGITAKTADTLYCNQISYQTSGNLFDCIIKPVAGVTADRTHQLQNRSGTLAHTDQVNEYLTSTSTPATLTTSPQNNYNPTGKAPGAWLRLSSTTNIDLTGIQKGTFTDRQTLVLTNIGTNDIKLKNNDLNSAAGNRFLIRADITLKQLGDSCTIIYDSIAAGWRVIGLQMT